MAKVLGIGGIFFKSPDSKALAAWYGEHLGLEISAWGGAQLTFDRLPAGQYAVWSPFAANTKHFDPSPKDFMFNLIVDDVSAALQQVKAGGAELVGEIDESDYGRFGWFLDPDGNKVELWQPPAA